MKIFVFGSSIVSSYWNGAATYYRGIYKYLARAGHTVTFAEPDAYGRQQHRDRGDFSYVESLVYAPGTGLDAMMERAQEADVVIKHSGIGADDEELEARVSACKAGALVCFWDVDSPATIARMRANPHDALLRALPDYDAVLSYGGGPVVERDYLELGARRYYSIYNGLDPETHHPVDADPELSCDLAFLGNRLPDREARVEELFLRAATLLPHKRFLLGGEGWGDKPLPPNVRWIGHVPTAEHNRVNCSAKAVLNVNRSSMAQAGFSPPTRIFEVAGAGAAMICDAWPGLDDVFTPGEEILVASTAEEVATTLESNNDAQWRSIGERFRARALRDHTYAQRAAQATAVFEALQQFRGTHHVPACPEPAAV